MLTSHLLRSFLDCCVTGRRRTVPRKSCTSTKSKISSRLWTPESSPKFRNPFSTNWPNLSLVHISRYVDHYTALTAAFVSLCVDVLFVYRSPSVPSISGTTNISAISSAIMWKPSSRSCSLLCTKTPRDIGIGRSLHLLSSYITRRLSDPRTTELSTAWCTTL